MKKTVLNRSVIFCLLTVVFLIGLAFDIKSVTASGTIYISATGEVVGTDKIQRDGNTYTFVDNIYNKSIIVERDHIVIDGAEFALEGKGNKTGIDMSHRTNITLKDIHILRFETGILLNYSSNNKIWSNSFTNNTWAIGLANSTNNRLSANQVYISYPAGVGGIWFTLSSGNSVSENIIAGVGVYGIHLYRSNSNNAYNNTISRIREVGGITLWKSFYNRVYKNDISDGHGIWLWDSSYNIITENMLNASSWYTGLEISNSSDNRVYHNSFMINKDQIWIGHDSVNIWDNGIEGNYWSNYTGVDSQPDGIGDTLFIIDANNTDNRPLMGIFSSTRTTYQHPVNIISNSSVSDFNFTLTGFYEAQLTFNVTGKSGTPGFCRVCIPKALINGSYTVKFNGETITPPQVRELPCSNQTYEYLYINYTHSEHKIEISGTTIIPEFPSILILPLFMIATLVAVIVYRRKQTVCVNL